MDKQRRQLTVLLVVVVGALAGAAAPASAGHWWWYNGYIVHLQGGHFPGFGFYNGADQDAEVRTRFEYSRGHWNYAPYTTIGNVANPAAAQVRAYDAFYGYTGWAGLATVYGWDGVQHATYMTTEANLTYMQGSPYNSWQYKQAVTCHEIGHAIAGLGEQTGSDASCMAVGYSAPPGAFMTDQRYRVPSPHDREHQRHLWGTMH